MNAQAQANLAWFGDVTADPQAPLLQASRLQALGLRACSTVHDFNNLLMVVQGNLAILRRKVKEPEAEPHLDIIHQAAQRAIMLARELLTYARGGISATKTLDLDEAVAGALPAVRQLVGPSIAIQQRRAGGPAYVDICPIQLEAAILNLAANARDAMPSGGVLEIAVRADPDLVELSISDTGAGVPPEVLPRVFDAFFTTKSAGNGTGLGLAQVNEMARNAGGLVQIRSTVGQGTTVTVRLPRMQDLPRSHDAKLSSGPRDREGRRILLVDDDVALRTTVASFLRESALTVHEAGDAAEALSMLEAEPFDALVSDIVMPSELNGLGLARAARTRRPALPILLMSGDEPSVADATASGFIALNKPFDLTELERRLRAEALSS